MFWDWNITFCPWVEAERSRRKQCAVWYCTLLVCGIAESQRVRSTSQCRSLHITAFVQTNSHTMSCGERWERKRKKLAFLHRARPTRAKTKSWLQKAGEADVISLPGLWGDLQEKQGASRERGARAVSGIQKQEQCLISSKKSESEEWYSLFRCVQKRSSEESEQDFGNWIPKL